MKVFITYQVIGNDLHFRFASETTPMSEVIVIQGRDSGEGNPYLVYGDALKPFLESKGLTKYKININVSRITSGDIS